MATAIIEGISNEVLVFVSVFVAVVTIFLVHLLYKWNSRQSTVESTAAPSDSMSSSSLNERSQGNLNEEQGMRQSRTDEPVISACSQETPLLVHNDTDNARASTSATDGSIPITDRTSDVLRQRVGEQLPQHTNQSQPHVDNITIRIKHMENERTVTVRKTISVAELKRFCFQNEINRGKRVRLIYSGRLLQDDNEPVSFYGVTNHSVVHAQISDVRRDHEHSSTAFQETDLDVSKLFLPLLAIILVLCWFGFFYYRHLFSAASVIILVFMTIAFGVLAHIMTS